VPEQVSPAVQRRRPQILVVDDDPQGVTLIGTWLADVGDVHQATTSAQAYALATAIQPNLAIIDVILPRTDGLTLLASLRRQPTLALMSVISSDTSRDSFTASSSRTFSPMAMPPSADRQALRPHLTPAVLPTAPGFSAALSCRRE